MSVTFAPRARISVNASWPGVSRNTTRRPLTSTEYAPMCCVMPPASRSATFVVRMRVEQRGLAVVDVAHDGDHRRARDQIFRLRRLRFDFGQFFLEAANQHLGAEIARQHLRGVRVERRVDRHHHAAVEDLLHHVLDLHFELVGEVLHRHAFGERDELGDRRQRFLRRRHRRPVVAPAHASDADRPAGTGRRLGAAGIGGRGAPGADGRTGCDGSGRGPPSGGRDDGPMGHPASLPGARRRAASRPVGSAPAAPAACGTTGRCGTGRAAGASPVSGSSMRSRRVGGTMRPGTRGGAGARRHGAGAAAAFGAAGAARSSAARPGFGGRLGGRAQRPRRRGGASTTSTGTASSGTSTARRREAASTASGSGRRRRPRPTSCAGLDVRLAPPASPAGFTALTRRGRSTGAAGLGGSGALAPCRQASWPRGRRRRSGRAAARSCRLRAWRSTNCRATISSIELDALLTSMPVSFLSRFIASWLERPSNSATL